MSLVVAESMLRNLDKKPYKDTARDTDNLGGFSYNNKYDAWYDKYSKDSNFNYDMWRSAQNSEEQDKYMAFLTSNEGKQLSPKFYDERYYNYEEMMLELYANSEFVDNTNLSKRTTQKFDPKNNKWVDVDLGEMTDKQYIQYQLEQSRKITDLKIKRQEEALNKERMSNTAKSWGNFKAIFAELGEGFAKGGAGILDFFAAVGNIQQATEDRARAGGGGYTMTGLDGSTKTYSGLSEAIVGYYGEQSLTEIEQTTLRAKLDEYERVNTTFKDVDGNMTTLGKYAGGIANSIGMMLPSMLVTALSGGVGGIGQATFYTSILAGNINENANNPNLINSPANVKLANAALKTTAEWAVEAALGKIFGGTIQNAMIGFKGGHTTLSRLVTKPVDSLVGKLATKNAKIALMVGGLATVGKSALQEGTEEFLQDFSTNLIDQFTGMMYDGYQNTGVTFQTLVDSFCIGALSSLVMSGGEISRQSVSTGVQNLNIQRKTGQKGLANTYIEDVKGAPQKVGALGKMYLSSLFENLNNSLERLKKQKSVNARGIKLAQETNAAVTSLLDFYSGFDKTRLENSAKLLSKVMENEQKSKEQYEKVATSDTGTASLYRQIVRRSQQRANATVIREYVTSMFKNINAIADSPINTVIKARRKEIEDAIKEKIDKLKEGNTENVIDVIDTSTNLEQQVQAIENRLAGKEDEPALIDMLKKYGLVLTTDGHVAVESGKILFVPQKWLINYKTNDIYAFLTQEKILKKLIDTVEAPNAGAYFKKFLDRLVAYDKRFTGRTQVSKERALMDLLFNSSVYQGFILSEGSKTTVTNAEELKHFLFNIHDIIKSYIRDDLASEADKGMANDIYDKIRNTMRIPTMKAMLIWGFTEQDLGAKDVLTDEDRLVIEQVNARKQAQFDLLKPGPPTQANRILAEDMIRTLEEERQDKELIEILRAGTAKNANMRQKIEAYSLVRRLDTWRRCVQIRPENEHQFVLDPLVSHVKGSPDFIQALSDAHTEFKRLYGDLDLLNTHNYGPSGLKDKVNIDNLVEGLSTYGLDVNGRIASAIRENRPLSENAERELEQFVILRYASLLGPRYHVDVRHNAENEAVQITLPPFEVDIDTYSSDILTKWYKFKSNLVKDVSMALGIQGEMRGLQAARAKEDGQHGHVDFVDRFLSMFEWFDDKYMGEITEGSGRSQIMKRIVSGRVSQRFGSILSTLVSGNSGVKDYVIARLSDARRYHDGVLNISDLFNVTSLRNYAKLFEGFKIYYEPADGTEISLVKIGSLPYFGSIETDNLSPEYLCRVLDRLAALLVYKASSTENYTETFEEGGHPRKELAFYENVPSAPYIRDMTPGELDRFRYEHRDGSEFPLRELATEDLFEMDRRLGEIDVSIVPLEDYNGNYVRHSSTIQLAKTLTARQFRFTFKHELGHGIQHKQNLPNGISPARILSEGKHLMLDFVRNYPNVTKYMLRLARLQVPNDIDINYYKACLDASKDFRERVADAVYYIWQGEIFSNSTTGEIKNLVGYRYEYDTVQSGPKRSGKIITPLGERLEGFSPSSLDFGEYDMPVSYDGVKLPEDIAVSVNGTIVSGCKDVEDFYRTAGRYVEDVEDVANLSYEPLTEEENKSVVLRFMDVVRRFRAKNAKSPLGNDMKRNTVHSRLKSMTRTEVLAEIVEQNLPFVTRTILTIDEVIKNPEAYLSGEMMDLIGDDLSEGHVFHTIKSFLEKKLGSISIDRDARSHEYILVDDNAFDDLLTTDALLLSRNDVLSKRKWKDKYVVGEKYLLSNFYRLEALNKLGLLTDVTFVISDTHKTETTISTTGEVTIYIQNLSDLSDAVLIDRLNHELRHVLQIKNGLESGFTPDFKVTDKMLVDLKTHIPELFASKTMRQWAKLNMPVEERSSDKKIDIWLAQHYIYFSVTGEINGQGLDSKLIDVKPSYVSFEVNEFFIFMPWYNEKTGEGMYSTDQIEFLLEEDGTRAFTKVKTLLEDYIRGSNLVFSHPSWRKMTDAQKQKNIDLLVDRAEKLRDAALKSMPEPNEAEKMMFDILGKYIDSLRLAEVIPEIDETVDDDTDEIDRGAVKSIKETLTRSIKTWSKKTEDERRRDAASITEDLNKLERYTRTISEDDSEVVKILHLIVRYREAVRELKPMPKDTAPKDTAPKDTAPKDTAPKDTAPKDTKPKDTKPKTPARTITSLPKTFLEALVEDRESKDATKDNRTIIMTQEEKGLKDVVDEIVEFEKRLADTSYKSPTGRVLLSVSDGDTRGRGNVIIKLRDELEEIEARLDTYKNIDSDVIKRYITETEYSIKKMRKKYGLGGRGLKIPSSILSEPKHDKDDKKKYSGRVYVSKAESEGNNLRYFQKVGEELQMKPALRDFIRETTGNEDLIDKPIITAITSGRLTESLLYEYIREVGYGEMNDFTFKLINKHLFKNKYFKSLNQLDKMNQREERIIFVWALARVLVKEGKQYEALITGKSIDELYSIIEQAEDSTGELANAIRKEMEAFYPENLYDKTTGKLVSSQETLSETQKNYMRILLLKNFNGTLADVYYAANLYRETALHIMTEAINVERNVYGTDEEGNAIENIAGGTGDGDDSAVPGVIYDRRQKTSERDEVGRSILKYHAYRTNLTPPSMINNLMDEYEDIFIGEELSKITDEDTRLRVRELLTKTDAFEAERRRLTTELEGKLSVDQLTEEQGRRLEIFTISKTLRQTLTTKRLKFVKEHQEMPYDTLVREYEAYENRLTLGIDVGKRSTDTRRNIQTRMQNRANRILQYIKTGEYAFKDLPQEVQDLFHVVSATSSTGKKTSILELKKEVYQVGRGRRALTDTRGGGEGEGRYYAPKTNLTVAQQYKHDTTEIAKNDTLIDQALKNVKAIIRARKEAKKDTRSITREDYDLSGKKEEAVTHVLAGQRKETVTRVPLKTKPEKERRPEREAWRTEPTHVLITSPRGPAPKKFADIVGSFFADTEMNMVQFASIDRNTGKLYEKTDEEFEGRLEHEVMSWEKFYKLYRGDLLSMTREDILDIVDFLRQGVSVRDEMANKLAAIQIFILGFFVDVARHGYNGIEFTEDERTLFRETYERKATLYGSGLAAVSQMIKVVRPLASSVGRALEDYGIPEPDIVDFIDAIHEFQDETDPEVRIERGKDLAKQIKDIERLMLEGDKRFKDSKKRTNKDGTPKRVLPIYDQVKSWRYLSMLSSPVTWARNLISNTSLRGLTSLSDKIGAVMYKKKAYHAGQINFSALTTSAEVAEFIRKEFIENSLFESFYEVRTKYDERGKGIDKKGDIFAKLMKKAIEDKYMAAHRFDAKTMNDINVWIMKRLSDQRFVKAAVEKYFGKLLTRAVERGEIKLNEGMGNEILNLFAESVILAGEDYMHKRSFMADALDAIRKKAPVVSEIISIFQPFLNSSFNWFSEAIKFTPIGLAGALWKFGHLEKQIGSQEDRRKQGYATHSSKFVEYLIRRDIGKGIIGLIGVVFGAVLGLTGVLRIDDDDKEMMMVIGDVKIKIDNIFGSSSILIGAALFGQIGREKFEDIMITACNALFEGFLLRDLLDRHRWDKGIWEGMLTEAESVMKSFVPQMIQAIMRSTTDKKIKYSAGAKGMIERFVNSFVPGQPLGERVINPYTGEEETKYAIPFVGEVLKSGVLGPRIFWSDVSDGEKLAIDYDVNKKELTGEITIKGEQINLSNVSEMNRYYGKLNAERLSNIEKDKHYVQGIDGKFKTLAWSEMTDAQRVNVLESMFSKNANYAKIYNWTNLMNKKYYCNRSMYNQLKELGITKNVYLGDKGFVG